MQHAAKPAPPVALVTGASRGLGRAMSVALAGAGYRLALTARHERHLEATCSAVRAHGTEALALAADLRQPPALQALAERLQQHYGRLDLLVNNAGLMGGEVGVRELTPTLWNELLAVNLTGPFLCSRALLPLLEATGGCIVNISSGAAVRTGFLNLAYGVSKAGLDRLTLGLAAELGERVACVSLSPPASATETVRRLYAGQDVDAWAAPPELTARALLRLLELGPGRYSGQVISARDLLGAGPNAPDL